MAAIRYAVFCGLAVALAGCAAPLSSCPLRLDADLPVSYIDGTIPVITVEIKNHDVRMMVDSGAGESSISTVTYNRLNMTGTAAVRGYSIGVGGDVESNTVVMQDLGFGAVHLKQEVLDVNDGVIPHRDGRLLVDGVFGDDILNSFDIGFDLPDNRIMLFDQQSCTGAQTPWPGSYAAAPITVNKETFISTIPFTVDGQDLAAVIDSGSDTTLIAAQSLDRLGIKPETMPRTAAGAMVGIGGHQVEFYREQFANLQIGAESIDDPWLFVAKSPISQFNDMLLGEDYLSRHRVFVSNATDTVYLGLAVPRGG